MKKYKTISKYWGLDYVTVHIPISQYDVGRGVIIAKVLDQIDKEVARQIIKKRSCLRGLEVKFIRKALGLSARALGELMDISHVSILKWEKAQTKPLDRAIQIAFTALTSNILELDLDVKALLKIASQRNKAVEVKGRSAS